MIDDQTQVCYMSELLQTASYCIPSIKATSGVKTPIVSTSLPNAPFPLSPQHMPPACNGWMLRRRTEVFMAGNTAISNVIPYQADVPPREQLGWDAGGTQAGEVVVWSYIKVTAWVWDSPINLPGKIQWCVWLHTYIRHLAFISPCRLRGWSFKPVSLIL